MQNGSPLVFSATAASFESSVVARSHSVPVLVDFWAPWCGPCRVLTPVLEKAIAAHGGRVLLAKVNTDEEQALAARFRISGIPAVKAFSMGQIKAEFVGARDARFVEEFLKQLLPRPGEAELAQAASQLAQGAYEQAAETLKQLCEARFDEPVRSRAIVLYADSLLRAAIATPAEVMALLQTVDPRSAASERAEELVAVAGFFSEASLFAQVTAAQKSLAENDRDCSARFVVAADAARHGDFDAAFEHLLAIVARDRKFRDDGARKAMAALFLFLGQDSDLVHAFRRRLQVVL